jgi:hypothetical protein
VSSSKNPKIEARPFQGCACANGDDVQSDESDSSNSSDKELCYGDRERGARATEFGSKSFGKGRLNVGKKAGRRTNL